MHFPTPDAKLFQRTFSSKKRNFGGQSLKCPSPPTKSPTAFYNKKDILNELKDRFDKVQELGSGSFSQVFKAREKLTNIYYAVKQVKKPRRAAYKELENAIELQNGGDKSLYLLPTNDTQHSPPQITFHPHSPSSSSHQYHHYHNHSPTNSNNYNSGGGYSSTNGVASSNYNNVAILPPSHAHLVRYLQLLTPYQPNNPEMVAFLIEFIEGGTLESRLENAGGPIPEYICWKWIKQLLEAIAYIHDKGFIHLDIKPGNILITNEGDLKLSDFGTMIKEGEFEPHSTDEGDDRYMAPELLGDDADQVTSAADMFSLGVLVLEMSTDIEIPKGGDGVVWQNLRNNVFPLEHLSKLSPDLQNLIVSLLQSQPDKRPSAESLLSSRIFNSSNQPTNPVDESLEEDQLQMAEDQDNDISENTTRGGSSRRGGGGVGTRTSPRNISKRHSRRHSGPGSSTNLSNNRRTPIVTRSSTRGGINQLAVPQSLPTKATTHFPPPATTSRIEANIKKRKARGGGNGGGGGGDNRYQPNTSDDDKMDVDNFAPRNLLGDFST